MRLALVYDRINKFGGAERILLALHEIWPDAPLYTAVYDCNKARWAKVFNIKPSCLRYFPFLNSRHEILPLITPLIFESFNFNDFDVVLTITSSDAKGIITKKNTLHICYCLTPTRYLWSGYWNYYREPGINNFNSLARMSLKLFNRSLRHWDYLSAQRPDYYLAISHTVAERIRKYYNRKAEIIYPPVNLSKFKLNKNLHKSDQKYYLIVSRLVSYKNIDYVIKSFNRLGWNLKIIGDGLDRDRLKKMAKANIEFIADNLTDEKLCCYYQNCKALIFPGEEDFGLTAVEAQACGRPVIAYNRGGVRESVIAGVSGELYDYPTEDSLISILKIFQQKHYSPENCRNNAKKFSQSLFQKKIKKKIENYWYNWKLNL